MNDEFVFYTINPHKNWDEGAEIQRLLTLCDLDMDEGIETFVVGRQGRRLVACAGLDGDIVKCVATAPDLRGESLSLKLMGEVINLAVEQGHLHLFLFTHPSNVSFFGGCGFYELAEVPGYVTLMENTPVGIKRYSDQLRKLTQPGDKIGCIVMNANPFTFGHQYLVRLAASQCDWLHVFVVREDVSQFSYRDRYALVSAGVAGVPNLTLHHGSEYMVSRATFPDYFFKEKGMVGECCSAIDLILFRKYIAPALGITHRFVGTEPFCKTTRKYNDDMKQWLQVADSSAPAVTVVEVPRTVSSNIAISASEVRRLLRSGDMAKMPALVPRDTLNFLYSNYAT
ncbi:MAG: [citrate (pro-3S)-lyase] ligase [Rhodocyclales bacterium GT-UBC]|nr:MAG: [citrate (pro-3S)-lyase] ligase [Rhodocyclales bacterium GT-UBC]